MFKPEIVLVALLTLALLCLLGFFRETVSRSVRCQCSLSWPLQQCCTHPMRL